ncbi:glycosyl hydrolase family 71-domain-containing protein [Armillaria fumosa]|nr:glycosyl hydrolase family 71-domain-containing protein [Armillaria fumosa]
MLFFTFLLQLLSFITFTNALAIPFRRAHFHQGRNRKLLLRQSPSTISSSVASSTSNSASSSVSVVASAPSCLVRPSSSSASAVSVSTASDSSGNATLSSSSATATASSTVLVSTASDTVFGISSSATEAASSSTPVLTSSNVNTATPTSSSATATASSSDTSKKFVVAHHMVGNTYPYTSDDWAEDISLASASGIDGFALNVGVDNFQKDQVAAAYDAAQQSGLDFKLFLSLDMTSLPCATADDAQSIRSWVKTYTTHSNQLMYDSRALVSTFSGESCTFGQSSVAEGWKSQFVQHSDLQGQIFFVPSFFVDPSTFSEYKDVMDGDYNWNSGWPVDLTTSVADAILANASSSTSGSTANASLVVATVVSATTDAESALSRFIGSTETDQQHLEGLAALSDGLSSRDESNSELAYMAAVSPWFFTHYGPDSYNKNFVYLSDEHLYSRRWESLVASRDSISIVEINTWNDYGESHYIGPIKGAQPNSEAWTNGMNHTAWLGLTAYYASAFKTGTYPTIEKDQIYMWSRPHPANAEAPDSVAQPTNYQLFQDYVWAVVLTTAPSSVTLSTSDSSSQTFDVPAGLSKLSVPISPGDTMKGTIARDGQTVVELNADNFTFQGSPQTYNYNAFVASACAE